MTKWLKYFFCSFTQMKSCAFQLTLLPGFPKAVIEHKSAATTPCALSIIKMQLSKFCQDQHMNVINSLLKFKRETNKNLAF